MIQAAGFLDENWRFWSGLRDSNPRSLEPKSSAIPNFAKSGYEILSDCRCGQICGQQNCTTFSLNFQRRYLRGLTDKQGSVQHINKSNRFGVPAPKPSALLPTSSVLSGCKHSYAVQHPLRNWATLGNLLAPLYTILCKKAITFL